MHGRPRASSPLLFKALSNSSLFIIRSPTSIITSNSLILLLPLLEVSLQIEIVVFPFSVQIELVKIQSWASVGTTRDSIESWLQLGHRDPISPVQYGPAVNCK